MKIESTKITGNVGCKKLPDRCHPDQVPEDGRSFFNAHRQKGLKPATPRGYWLEPENLRKLAKQVYQEEGSLAGHLYLSAAIRRRYPGGLAQIQQDLFIRPHRKANGFWSPEVIEQEARIFVNKHGDISHALLIQEGKGDLAAAIEQKYPGKTYHSLKSNIELRINRKPYNFWTNDQIESMAIEFYREKGVLNTHILEENGLSDLRAAISARYPGGFTELRVRLGIQEARKPRRYWNPEKIHATASNFYKDFGELSIRILRKKGCGDLLQAILRIYPGGFRQLKIDLGITIELKGSLASTQQANLDLDNLLEGNNG